MKYGAIVPMRPAPVRSARPFRRFLSGAVRSAPRAGPRGIFVRLRNLGHRWKSASGGLLPWVLAFRANLLQRGFSYGPPCRSFSCGTGRLPDGLRAIGPPQYRASNFRAGPCPAAGVRRRGAACCVRKRRACPVGGRLRTGMRPETIISGSALRERPPDARWARGKASS